MYKIVISILILSGILFATVGCNKSCECTQWTNNQEGQTYSVVLESDGSVCNDYTHTDTVNNMISGVICSEQEY